MALIVQAFPAGPLDTNAYLVADGESRAAILIDAPPGVTATLTEAVRTGGFHVERIVLTHVHWDHIADAVALRSTFSVPLVAHPLARQRLAAPPNELLDLPFTIPAVTPDGWIDEGDTVAVGRHTFAVLHLPGHDPAHVVLFSESDRVILGGDVLFPGGHGTTEIPLADQATMDRSIARLAALPPDVTVYPGHGRPTTIGAETAWTAPIVKRVTGQG